MTDSFEDRLRKGLHEISAGVLCATSSQRVRAVVAAGRHRVLMRHIGVLVVVVGLAVVALWIS